MMNKLTGFTSHTAVQSSAVQPDHQQVSDASNEKTESSTSLICKPKDVCCVLKIYLVTLQKDEIRSQAQIKAKLTV